jgi:flagellar hook protein FlgE
MPSDSMSIGVSGMDAYQAQIDVISNNIANVGTTGYKGQNLNFQDLLYQTQQAASAPTKTNGGVNAQQIGIGVKVGSTDTNESQGGVQTTGVSTNMMINGDGYFILNNADGTGAPKYTRNGDFSLNQNGLLFDPSSGLGVMGYTANSAGVVAATGSPAPIQIPIGLKSEAIATGAGLKQGPSGDKVFDMSFGGNLDSTQYSAAVSNGAVGPANFATAGTTIYDSLGTPHLVQVTFDPQIPNVGATPFQVMNASGTAVTAATEWAYTLASTDGTTFTTSAAGVTPVTTSTTSLPQYAFFDANGQFINTSGTVAPAAGILGGTLTSAAVHQTDGLPTLASGNDLTVAQWGTPAGANNAASGTATPGGVIGIDLSSMTAQGATSQVLSTGQNGVAPGILSNISVGQDGTITGAFTNGQSQTLARVAVATFQNEQGLTRTGGSDYLASADSGQAQIGTANAGRFGAIAGDSLELSNVSIADEFTKLITAQNAFTANSKSITTANNDLQTVINLIH